MIDKFALMLCPKRGCAKVGLAGEARCPTHDVEMVRTAAQTIASARKEKEAAVIEARASDLTDDVFKGMCDAFRQKP